MALAEAGKRITGLDLSERMLERAVKKRAALRVEARERLHLIQGDMARFDLAKDSAWLSFPSGHSSTFWKCAAVDCLDCVQKHLAPGGG